MVRSAGVDPEPVRQLFLRRAIAGQRAREEQRVVEGQVCDRGGTSGQALQDRNVEVLAVVGDENV